MTIPSQTHAINAGGVVDPVWLRFFQTLDRAGWAESIATIATALGSPDGTVANIPPLSDSQVAIAQGIGIQVTGNSDDGYSIALRPVADSGAGSFKLVTRDGFGRVSGSVDGGAADIPYDPTASGLSATDVQAAIDETVALIPATTDDLPEGTTNLYFTAARVLATVLSGLSTATNAVITASDTVLQALGKLQAQVSAIASSFVPSTRTISTTAPLTGGGDLSANRTLAISAATTSAAGSMSAADKTKLDGMTAGASVSSVGLSLPSIFTVSGSPVTTSGVLTGTLASQAQNLVWASPNGASGTPTFRALVSADIPNLDWSKITTGKPTTLSGYGITDAVDTATNQTGIAGNKEWVGDSRLYSTVPSVYHNTVVIDDTAAVGGSGQCFQGTYYSSLPGPAQIQLRKAGGTEASPSANSNGDVLFRLDGAGHDGSAFKNGVFQFHGITSQAWNGTANGTRFRIRCTPLNATSFSECLAVDANLNLTPGDNDNTYSCGTSALRWSVVYAGTGTINTSDAREKTPPRDMTASELAAGIEICRLPCVYQWLEAIARKGEDEARLHVSPTVQAIIAVMESHGLDPFRYGMICHDTWDEQPEVLDHDGLVDTPYRAAGDRYSLRHGELAHFCLRATASRLDALEARIAAIEAVA